MKVKEVSDAISRLDPESDVNLWVSGLGDDLWFWSYYHFYIRSITDNNGRLMIYVQAEKNKEDL